MDDINLTDYLQTIWRRKFLVATIGVFAALIALVVLLVTPHTYRGRAVLIFPHPEQSSAAGVMSKLGLSGLADFGISSGNGPEMYMGILKSRTLTEQVCKDLQISPLLKDDADLLNNIEVTVEKNGTLELCCYVPSSWVKSGKIKRKLTGENVDRQTAHLAADLANDYIERLQEFDIQHSLNTGHRNRVFLEGEVEKTRQDLTKAEDTLRKFIEKHPAVPPPETVDRQVEQLTSIRTRQIEAEAELRETEKSVEQARREVGDNEAEVKASKVIQQNPVVSELKSRLADAEILRASLLEDMTEKSPDVVAATHDIEKIQAQIKSEIPKITASETIQLNPVRQTLIQDLAQLEIKKSGVQARNDTLGAVLSRVEGEISKVAKDQMQYVRYARDVKALEAVYTSLLTQLSQAKVLEAKEPDGFTVLDWAVAEKYKFKPKIKFTLAASFFFGLIAGCLIALIQEGSHPTVKKRKMAE